GLRLIRGEPIGKIHNQFVMSAGVDDNGRAPRSASWTAETTAAPGSTRAPSSTRSAGPAEGRSRQRRSQPRAKFVFVEQAVLVRVPFNEPLLKRAFQFGASKRAILVGVRSRDRKSVV